MKPILTTALLSLILAGCSQTKEQDISTSDFSDRDFSRLNDQIVELFDAYDYVGVGEGMHGSNLTAEWQKSILWHKGFQQKVRNIVVEFGTSRYQDIMDDFVYGKEVPDSVLAKTWQETINLLWDNPIYEGFCREVRKVNKTLPQEEKFRIVLIEPHYSVFKIDTNVDRTGQNLRDYLGYQEIKKKVINEKEKALIVYGDMHLNYRSIFQNYENPENFYRQMDSTAADMRLDLAMSLKIYHPDKTYMVWGSLPVSDSSYERLVVKEENNLPSLISLNGSPFGDIDFTKYYPYNYPRRINGKEIDKREYIEMPIKSLFDGLAVRGTREEQHNTERRSLVIDEWYKGKQAYLRMTIVQKLKGIYNSTEDYYYYLYTFQYFRWSEDYGPFIEQLKTDDTDKHQEALLEVQNKYATYDWAEFNWYRILKRTANRLTSLKDHQTAVHVAELNLRNHPDRFNEYEELGDAYLKLDKKEKADRYYKIGLEKDPGSEILKKKLEGL